MKKYIITELRMDQRSASFFLNHQHTSSTTLESYNIEFKFLIFCVNKFLFKVMRSCSSNVIWLSITLCFMLANILETKAFFDNNLETTTSFSGGTGSVSDPYQISTWAHLDQIRNHLSSHFILLNDLNQSTPEYDDFASSFANSGVGWIPIPGFAGSLDGDGNVIKGLFIKLYTGSEAGFFGSMISGSGVKNIGFLDSNVTGSQNVGILVGLATGVILKNVFVSGEVTGYGAEVRVGGLVGHLSGSSKLDYSFSTANVKGEGEAFVRAGGIVGELNNSQITYSYSTGNVNGERDFFSSGSIPVQAGGFVGRSTTGQIRFCYSSGLVTGSTSSSVLVLRGFVGAIVSGSTISNSFWDMESSTQDLTAGSSAVGGSSTRGLGKSTTEMKIQSTFSNWDFGPSGAWEIEVKQNGFVSYPYLKDLDYDFPLASPQLNPIPGLEKNYYNQGSGTVADPFQITNWEDLHNMREKLSGSYILLNDLDENTEGYVQYASPTTDNNKGWLPIGLDNFEFAGNLNGNGHVIKKLYVNRTSSLPPRDYAGGLFGIMKKGEIKNLGIVEATIISRASAGILVAETGDVKIENVFTTGLVTGQGGFATKIGGIAGLTGVNTTIKTSYSTASVKATNEDGFSIFVGGLVGDCMGKISNSYSTGSVIAQGSGFAFTIAGGLLGKAGNLIENCYSLGKVTANSQDATPDIGGLIGLAFSATIQNSFWNTETSEQQNSVLGTGKSITAMKEIGTFTNWDFTPNNGIWKIKKSEDGFVSYPYLQALSYDLPLAEPAKRPIPGLEVVMRSQIINFSEITSKIYGDEVFTLGEALTDRGLTVSYKAEDPTVVSITGNKATILKAGNTKIIATQTGSIQYFPADTVSRILVVGKAPLEIKADLIKKIVGTHDPVLTYVSSGWKNTDNKTILTGKLKRQPGEEIGEYPIEIGTLSVSDNYEIEFIPNKLQISLAELKSFKEVTPINTPWSKEPSLPSVITGLTDIGVEIELQVTWDKKTLNVLKRGKYVLNGVVNLPLGVITSKEIKVSIEINVLAKEAPSEIKLDNNKFESDSLNSKKEIGSFTVVDSFDSTHLISLVPNSEDNKYFTIVGDKLKWTSSDPAKGKTEFKIKIKVEDRDGNVIEKIFTIMRIEFEPVVIPDKEDVDGEGNIIREIPIEPFIFNVFTPDGDGVNDTWGVPDLKLFPDTRVEVYDRNGKLLFFTDNAEKRWDATFEDKKVPVGTYFWVVENKTTGDVKRGVLTILRK